MNQEKYNEIYRAVCARVEALGYECAGFEAVSENGMNIVRVYLEMPGGIDTGTARSSRATSENISIR